MAEVKTQNGPADPDMRLQEDGLRTIVGGGGSQGLNKLGLPYPTNAIGSGPEIMCKETNKIRKGTSFEQNRLREPDRAYDRIQERS
jgi:hypothetical protein